MDSRPTSDTPSLSSWTVQPSRWTFESTKLRQWVTAVLPGDGRVLNACCGPTVLDYDGEMVRVDIADELTVGSGDDATTVSIPADYYRDIRSLGDVVDPNSFDAILFDPPFSAHQAESSYNADDPVGTDPTTYDVLDTLLKPGGQLITFGFTSRGMPAEYEYNLCRVAHWNTLGRQYDWVSTVEHAPSAQSGSNDRWACSAETAVLPNEPAIETAASQATSGGDNGGEPISFHYDRVPTTTDVDSRVRARLLAQREGRTLVLDPDLGPTSDNAIAAGVLAADDAAWPTSPWYCGDISELSDEFPDDSFESVLYRPTVDAFQHTVEYHGTTTGRDTAVKQEIDAVLAPGGVVVQAGHTATLMPSRLSYRRDRIEMVVTDDARPDVYLTTDRLTQSSFAAVTRRSHVQPVTKTVDVVTSVYSGDHAWACGDCQARWARPPAYSVSCPECGAHSGNYCVSEGATVLSEPHGARWEAFDAAHRRVEHPDELCKDRFGPHCHQVRRPSGGSDSSEETVEEQQNPTGGTELAATRLSEFATS
jgi:hypothetical protein